ncbi:MAG: hypothetical protein OEV43_04080, partial [Coriobacteriia bacterium]|nr:hypothetical protein [Coriobacteriia bacterium]
MTKALSPGFRRVLLPIAVCLFVAGVWLTGLIPAVKLLGDNVRLPIFHGGSTWVSLATFTLAGLLAAAYLATRSEGVYRWAAGFWIVSVPLWVLNTVLGVIAAMRTWDFSGSSVSPILAIREDPRLLAQFELLLILALVVAADFMYSSHRVRALLNVVFLVVMWSLLGWVFLNPQAKALHPDNPVLNSGWEIKGPFFA